MKQRRRMGGQSANQKIVSVNDKMGFKGIQNQQGTSRAIYDAVQLTVSTASQTIRFFENVNTKKFPFANITENKLQVGESMTMQRFSIALLQVQTSTQRILSVDPIDYFFETQGIYRSDLNFNIAQDQVIKKLPLHTMFAPFNKDSKFYGSKQSGTFQNVVNANTLLTFGIPQDIFHFDNPIVIPPQIEFYADLQLPVFALPVFADTTFYLMMTLEGFGSLYAPKATY